MTPTAIARMAECLLLANFVDQLGGTEAVLESRFAAEPNAEFFNKIGDKLPSPRSSASTADRAEADFRAAVRKACNRLLICGFYRLEMGRPIRMSGIGRLFSVWLLLLCAAAPIPHEPITGPARIIDGDTLQIAQTRIRLFAIDAPERKQSCRDDRGAVYA